MTSNVLRFDFEEMARLAREDPEGLPYKREVLIRQMIDRAPRTEHLTELQKTLNQACYRFVATSIKIGPHNTDMMLQAPLLMVAQMAILNRSTQEASLSDGYFGRRHEHSLV